MQKALLKALLTPWETLRTAQDSYDHTLVLELEEEIKTLPWNEVWNEYLERNNVPSESSWLKVVREYEENILKERN